VASNRNIRVFVAIKKDIQTRSDIKKLVSTFYEKLLKDKEFSHIFLEVAKIDVLEHLDIMIDFWESVLFQVGKYKGDTMETHLDLHQQHRLEASHFKKWLKIFNETIDELFEGEKATQAKERARTIAAIIKVKINNLDKLRLEFNN
jgi:hemoglobin